MEALQEGISSIEKVRVPVIAAINGVCLGAGNDFISACDIRICTESSKFSIKEVDLGLASDIGVHQRFQKVVGNGSWARELAYTGREFGAQEALAKGYVSKVFPTNEVCYAEAVKLATMISQKSPIAVTATKVSLNFSRDHTVQQGLDHIATLNAAMLQSDDLAKAATAMLTKQKPIFPKL